MTNRGIGCYQNILCSIILNSIKLQFFLNQTRLRTHQKFEYQEEQNF